MGTSKSQSTPSGGRWRSAKLHITNQLGSGGTIDGGSIAGRAISAAGRIGVGSSGMSPRKIGRVLSGLAQFSESVRTEGLDEALRRLNLEELHGVPAVQVITSVASYLSEGVEGIDGEILKKALRDSILEIAELGDETGYDNLESGLQEFLNANGVIGLVEIFLTHFIFDAVWYLIENHSQEKSHDEASLQALMSAVENTCRDEVRLEMADVQAEDNENSFDWFGEDGIDLGQRIINDLKLRLLALV